LATQTLKYPKSSYLFDKILVSIAGDNTPLKYSFVNESDLLKCCSLIANGYEGQLSSFSFIENWQVHQKIRCHKLEIDLNQKIYIYP
jgi:hypothetical protein